jgi:hypothetical protein
MLVWENWDGNRKLDSAGITMSSGNGKSNGDTIACPVCERPTSPAELSAFHGVCQFCQRSFLTANSLWVKKRFTNPETPEREILRAHHQPLEGGGDHDPAFDEHGQHVAVVDFDYDQIQLDSPTREFFGQASQDVRDDVATAFGMVLEWCWHRGFVSAQRKFAVVTAGLRPDLVDNESWEQIGERLGCGKAAISKQAQNFQNTFGLKFSRTRSEDARRHMAASMRGNRNHRKAGTPTT